MISCIAKWRQKSYKRGRTLDYVNFEFQSEDVYLKNKGKLDNRNMKTIAGDLDVTYVIKGLARDSVKLSSKLNNWSTNTITKARLAM